jgi:glutathione synthase/RimK-type ligase-like ATP-grasp enzyme
VRVGLATCAALPSGDPDDAHLLSALERAGISYVWIPWNSTDPLTLGDSVDALVLRSTWDYTDNYPEFMQWLDAIDAPIHNPRDIVKWNSDKRYLLELAAAGVPTVPTQIVESIDQVWDAPDGFAEFVVKPTRGAGSKGAKRFPTAEMNVARAHAIELIASGSPAMVQPYLPSVDSGSETALVHFDGVFSHSITKGPMLSKDGVRQMVDDLYVVESIEHRQASDAQKEVARQAIAAIPLVGDHHAPLYARVDVIDDHSGAPIVLELELVEPSLFFAFDPEAADRFAAAIRARV